MHQLSISKNPKVDLFKPRTRVYKVVNAHEFIAHHHATNLQVTQLQSTSLKTITTTQLSNATSKMKSAIIATISFLAAFVTANPTAPTVTLQLANDLSGANANKVILANGQRYTIADLFAQTAVDVDGQILVNSAQLVAHPPHVGCEIAKDRLIAYFTQDRTTADLDGNNEAAIPIRLNDAYVSCYAYSDQ